MTTPGAPPPRPPSSQQQHPPHRLAASPTYNKWVKLTCADVRRLRPPAQTNGFTYPSIANDAQTWYHLNHPIRFVYITGVVVGIEQFASRWGKRFAVLEVDDGSGACVEVKVGCVGAPLPASSASADAGRDMPAGREDDDEDEQEKEGVDPLTEDGARQSKHDAIPQVLETTVPGLTLHTASTTLRLAGAPLDIGVVLKAKGTLGAWRGAPQLLLRRAALATSLDEEVAAWEDYAAFAKAVLCKPWRLSEEEVAALDAAEEKRLKRVEERRERAERNRRRMRKREEREERRRVREAEELDGNALDGKGAARRAKHPYPAVTNGASSSVAVARVAETATGASAVSNNVKRHPHRAQARAPPPAPLTMCKSLAEMPWQHELKKKPPGPPG